MAFENSAENIRLLTFFVNGEQYCADISTVTDIIKIPPITFVPKLPDFIRGVINLRGKVVPVGDIAMRFGMEPEDYDDHSCVIVFSIRGTSAGLIVKRVGDVIDVTQQQIAPNVSQTSFISDIVTTEEGTFLKKINLSEIAEA
ncbi:MAG: purine-binding chemotaxis protein CheW [Oscillospiraceae bacterium]|nr:purine-binding chemotaxis protein CheW [Oscillospiraceae bacterium]